MYAEEDDMVESLKNLHPINERTTARRHEIAVEWISMIFLQPFQS